MSSVGVGQPSAPTINTSTPIDPSSMQRAYAALGLPYSSQATAQAQTQQAPGPGQTAGSQNAQAQQQQQLPQQMRPINALGKARQADFTPILCMSTFINTVKLQHTQQQSSNLRRVHNIHYCCCYYDNCQFSESYTMKPVYRCDSPDNIQV